MDNRDSFGSHQNIDVVSAVTESKPKPCFTITAITETKNIASFGAVTETKFRSVSNVLQGLSCKIHGKSCSRERDYIFVLVFYFFRFKPLLTGLNQLKPLVWQKQGFAGRNPTLT